MSVDLQPGMLPESPYRSAGLAAAVLKILDLQPVALESLHISAGCVSASLPAIVFIKP